MKEIRLQRELDSARAELETLSNEVKVCGSFFLYNVHLVSLSDFLLDHYYEYYENDNALINYGFTP